MKKTLADLVRLFILVNLIILAFHTLPKSEPGTPATTVTKQPLPEQPALFSEDGKAPATQTTTRFYLRTSEQHSE